LSENRCHFLRNVGVFSFQDLFASLHDRDAAAKPAEHLAKFKADIASAEYQQMFRDLSSP